MNNDVQNIYDATTKAKYTLFVRMIRFPRPIYQNNSKKPKKKRKEHNEWQSMVRKYKKGKEVLGFLGRCNEKKMRSKKQQVERRDIGYKYNYTPYVWPS